MTPEELYVGILTEEGKCYIAPFDGDIEQLEIRIAERFGSGCNWQVLSENAVHLGWDE